MERPYVSKGSKTISQNKEIRATKRAHPKWGTQWFSASEPLAPGRRGPGILMVYGKPWKSLVKASLFSLQRWQRAATPREVPSARWGSTLGFPWKRWYSLCFPMAPGMEIVWPGNASYAPGEILRFMEILRNQWKMHGFLPPDLAVYNFKHRVFPPRHSWWSVQPKREILLFVLKSWETLHFRFGVAAWFSLKIRIQSGPLDSIWIQSGYNPDLWIQSRLVNP